MAVLLAFFVVGSVSLVGAVIHGVVVEPTPAPRAQVTDLDVPERPPVATAPAPSLSATPSTCPSNAACAGRSVPAEAKPTRPPEAVPTTRPAPAPAASPGPTAVVRPPTPGAFTAKYQTISTRSASFRGKLTVFNRGATAQRWQVDLGLPPNVTVTWSSGGSYIQRAQTASFTWDNPLDPGGTLSLEFEADKTAQELADFVPRSCSVNGSACS